MLGLPLVCGGGCGSQDGVEPAVPGQGEAAGFPSGLRVHAGPEGQRPVLLLQHAALRGQRGLPAVLHGELVPVLRQHGLLHGERLQVVHPGVVLHLLLPGVPVAARRLPGGDAVVAAAAVQRLGVELLVGGAGVERVGRGEMATLRLQVGTHLNKKQS